MARALLREPPRPYRSSGVKLIVFRNDGEQGSGPLARRWRARHMAKEHAPSSYEFPRPSLHDESAERFELNGALRFETNPQMRICQEERPPIRPSLNRSLRVRPALFTPAPPNEEEEP